jgi:bifunctional oligoribonuclease and PAP phosphatase NrnA
MDQIIRHLKSSHRVFLASHTQPDGDAIGSLLALGLSLAHLNIRAALFNESHIPAVYRFLPGVAAITRHFDSQAGFDTAVILDCGSLQRIGAAATPVGRIPTIINVDHHVTNTGFGHFQLIDTSACSTAEIVFRLIKQLATPIDKAVATAIYTGILTDTGSFRFANTNSAAFSICDEMVRRGVTPSEVAQHVYGTYSMGRIKLLNLALDSIEISPNGKLSLMTLTRQMLRETNTLPEDADGIINYAKRIQDVRVAVLIQENGNGESPSNAQGRFHVSLRSDGTVDVAAIAAAFGGGGHCNAAGFNIEADMGELKSRIFDLAQKI